MNVIALIPAMLGAAMLMLPAAPTPAGEARAEISTEVAAVPAGRVDRDWMQSTYYSCNPRPHSEKAYKRTDEAPPTAPVATIVGSSGTVVVMATTIYNRNPQGSASYGVMSSDGQTLRSGTVERPGIDVLTGLTPGSRVYIQPRTMGTMAKILTPEQLQACGTSLPQ